MFAHKPFKFIKITQWFNWIFSSGFVLSELPENWAVHLSMPGMSAQMPQESVEKHSGLNPFTVTNFSVLSQVALESAADGAISV